MSHEILEVPVNSEKRKVEICHVTGRFFASKSATSSPMAPDSAATISSTPRPPTRVTPNLCSFVLRSPMKNEFRRCAAVIK
ncbi:tRNA_int_endo domain-containing protein [Caenorhabditis elegans]|uniref:tRNA_int_endo domain-containing protein n=1 Tax=Caenorhabditis elegans TaxID=6239 RepID=A0A486WY67_CAEEL|nr:tRNA_int_endo domain-containing protein [Caenorhabditis elegans]VGM69522.1 tRNA_int_endo domain-containing protein [Caenorhabditis elegans]